MLRLGSIEFINSLPVDFGILSGAVPADARIMRGAPAVLNEKILAGDLHISPISAFWYAAHQERFLLLPDLSVSSESGVKSVLLFARPGFKKLKQANIAVTRKGRTTPVLLDILCRMLYRIETRFENAAGQSSGLIPQGFDAALLIGDEALEAAERPTATDVEIIDLAEEWRKWTGLPIVFAVWAVRREIFAQCPEKVSGVHKALLASKRWGSEHPKRILSEAQRKTGLPVSALASYFSRLSYDFGEELKKGMRLYLDYAVQCGLLLAVEEFDVIASDSEAKYVIPA